MSSWTVENSGLDCSTADQLHETSFITPLNNARTCGIADMLSAIASSVAIPRGNYHRRFWLELTTDFHRAFVWLM